MLVADMTNESGDDAMAFNGTTPHEEAPVYLKLSIPMMVVYTLAYSLVFFLGRPQRWKWVIFRDP